MNKQTTNLLLLAAAGFIAYKIINNKKEESESDVLPLPEEVIEGGGEDEGEGTPEEIQGCTDPLATNYNPDATQMDNTCTYEPVVNELTDLTVEELQIREALVDFATLSLDEGGLGMNVIDAYDYLSPYYYNQIDGFDSPVFTQIDWLNPTEVNANLVPPSQWTLEMCANPFLCIFNQYDEVVSELGF